MNIILHTTNCPKCNILKKKLDSKGIEYKENFNIDVDYMLSLGIDTTPILQVDDEYMEFTKANEWVNNQ